MVLRRFIKENIYFCFLRKNGHEDRWKRSPFFGSPLRSSLPLPSHDVLLFLPRDVFTFHFVFYSFVSFLTLPLFHFYFIIYFLFHLRFIHHSIPFFTSYLFSYFALLIFLFLFYYFSIPLYFF
jgi:hypothetical protein